MQGPAWTPAQREARLAKLRERNRQGHSGAFLYEDARWMREAYENRRMSLRQMAAEAECGVRTIARWMAIHDIPTDPTRRPAPRTGPDHPRWKGGKPTCPRCGRTISKRAAHCQSCRDRNGPVNPKWRGEAAGYAAVHFRLVSERGQPSLHACEHCGEPAKDWAYDHADPAERRNTVGRDDGPFSLDPRHYLPLCRRCHRRLDANQ